MHCITKLYAFVPMSLYYMWQQAGGAIIMDADATAALHKRGIPATDDSYKFTWFQVSILFTVLLYRNLKINLVIYYGLLSFCISLCVNGTFDCTCNIVRLILGVIPVAIFVCIL